MRTYFVRTYRIEESELVMNKLKKFDAVIDIKRDPAIMCYESISFKCSKETWKTIKKELNLEIVSVFSKIRVGA